MKKSSLCLVLLTAALGFTGCQSTGDSNAGTPSDLSNMDINTNLPFSGQTLNSQQISDMNRICRTRRVSLSTQDQDFERSELASRNQDRSSCAMGASDSTTYQYQVGSYQIRAHRQITAVRQITQISGMIICHGRTLGHGLMTKDQVFTAKVINAGQSVYCKNDELYSATTLRLDDGTVVTSSRPQNSVSGNSGSNGHRSDVR